jgi:hypothetical protein
LNYEGFNNDEWKFEKFVKVMELKTRIVDGREEIFDEFRGRYVEFTPEENVRQWFAHVLVDTYAYPRGRIGIEISLSIQRKIYRSDLIVFDKEGKPWMVVECKSPEVNLTEKVFDQAVRYNHALKAVFIVLTNGKSTIVMKPDYNTGKIEFLSELPIYSAR